MSWEQAFPIGLRMPWMSLKLSFLLAVILVLAVGFGHKTWVGFFSDSLDIIKQFTSMISLLLISIFIDSVQGVISGMNITILYTTPFNYIFSVSVLLILIMQGWPEDVASSTWLSMLTSQTST